MDQDPVFGDVVRERRQIRDLTQSELARRTGCATITIRKIESNSLRPSVQIAERLAMALNIPMEDRGKFIALARSVLRSTPEPSPIPTPAPAPEEIGQADLSGRAIGGYMLGERIGAGGHGAVYRALQPMVERDVAIKIILPEFANHPDFIRRFEAEAQLVARLEHPYIVPLYDYWREPGVAYLVMRLMRGGSLYDLINEGPLPLAKTLQVMEQVGAALDLAHRLGVVHRDIKPANILLDEDASAYLADFGIAKNLVQPESAGQTQIGVIIGSPAYFAPEQIRSESIMPQTDIYCLGLLLYEMLSGQPAYEGPTPVDYMSQHLNSPVPLLRDRQSDLPPEIDSVISRATAKNPTDRYLDVNQFLEDLRGSSAKALTTTAVRQIGEIAFDASELENPYKGLRAFDEADAGDFYGRDNLIQELLSHMAQVENNSPGSGQDLGRFLAVIGPSGSGKSSVVKAGLFPALRRGGLPNSNNWFIVDFSPGSHPLEELEAALLRVAVNPPETLLGQLREDERGLLRAVRRVLPKDKSVELLLVIDQFEELFTLVQNEDSRVHFLDSLVTAVLDPRSRLRVIVTLRADFMDRPLRYVDIGELIRQRSELVLPLTPDELHEAVTRPAESVGLVLEDGLAATIVRDLGDQPGILPLLQYTLTELFERREGRTLTLSAYQEIGGVRGALARRAEDLYDDLDPTEEEAARQLFLRLVTLGEGIEDTRRRVSREELGSIAIPEDNQPISGSGQKTPIDRVIDNYGRYRLLTFDHHPVTRAPTVEVAHEALIGEWDRLGEWLDESRTDIRLQRVLASNSSEWLAAGEDSSYLLRGARLSQFEDWITDTPLALAHNETRFLESSILARDERAADEEDRRQRELETAQKLAETEHARAEEQTQSASRLRRRAYLLALLLVAATLLAVAAYSFARQSSNNASIAATREVEALAEADAKATAESEAITQAEAAAEAQIQAEIERDRAEAEAEARATQEAIAVAEAGARALAEDEAVTQRDNAQAQAELAIARELAASALVNLEVDPERSILLALHSLDTVYTAEGEGVLRRALQGSRVKLRLEPRLFPGERSDVSSVLSPGGDLVATWVMSQTEVWDATNGDMLWTLPGEQPVFNNDGSRLASSEVGEETISINTWNMANGELGETIVIPFSGEKYQGFFQVSPVHDKVAIGDPDGAVTVWDLALSEVIYTLETGQVNPITHFSADGSRLASGTTEGGPPIVWDVISGEPVTSPAEFLEGIMTLNADGSQLMTTSLFSNEIRVTDVDSGETIFSTDQVKATHVTGAFSRDGSRIVTGGFDDVISIWDLETGESVLALRGHTGNVGSLAFNPDGSEVVSAGFDGTVRIWDTTPAGLGEMLTITGAPFWHVVFDKDGLRLATSDTNGLAHIWDANTGELLLTLEGHEGSVYRVEFSPDGKYLATSGADNTARLWDAATGETLFTFGGHGEGLVGYFFPGVFEVAFSPDGRYLATGGADGQVQVWDLANSLEAGEGQLIWSTGAIIDGISNLTFSPDGSWLIANHDATETAIDTDSNLNALTTIWDTVTGELLTTLVSPSYRSFGLAVSPDQSILTTSRAGVGSIDFWDVGSGKLLFTLSDQTGTVHVLAFSPDGGQLASSSVDGSVRVWDLASQTPILSLADNTRPVRALAISPDGKRLVVAGVEGVARIYALDRTELLELARSRVTRSLSIDECRQYLHSDTCPAGP